MQDCAQAAGVDWFGDVVVSAGAHRLDCAVDGALGGDYDDRDGLIGRGQFFQQFEAAHARHFHVGQDDAGGEYGEAIQTFGAVAGGIGAIPPGRNQFRQTSALVIFVFDDQDFFLGHRVIRTIAIIEGFTVPRKGLELDIKPSLAASRWFLAFWP